MSNYFRHGRVRMHFTKQCTFIKSRIEHGFILHTATANAKLGKMQNVQHVKNSGIGPSPRQETPAL